MQYKKKYIHLVNNNFIVNIMTSNHKLIHCDFIPPENPDEMWVVWTTFNDTDDSTVVYGQAGWNMKATGKSTKFTDGGDEKRFWWVHKVVLKQLSADTNYSKSWVTNIL